MTTALPHAEHRSSDRAAAAARPPAIVAVATWRFLTIGLLAAWQGAFTFYGAVVIHVAHRVLGSHLPVGFVTQRVTNWLNLIAGASLALLLINLLLLRRRAGGWLMFSLAATWVIMLITLIALLVMHPALDHMLDAQLEAITDAPGFRRLHTQYITVATVQWAAGLLHLWCLMLSP